jgi:signal transduction histidine kinase
VRYTLAIDADLPPLDEALNMAVFRMVQESLTNVARHSAARTATVRLGLDGPATLLLRIEDDGRGLPADLRGPWTDRHARACRTAAAARCR